MPVIVCTADALGNDSATVSIDLIGIVALHLMCWLRANVRSFAQSAIEHNYAMSCYVLCSLIIIIGRMSWIIRSELFPFPSQRPSSRRKTEFQMQKQKEALWLGCSKIRILFSFHFFGIQNASGFRLISSATHFTSSGRTVLFDGTLQLTKTCFFNRLANCWAISCESHPVWAPKIVVLTASAVGNAIAISSNVSFSLWPM